jgi:hypothetical protein
MNDVRIANRVGAHHEGTQQESVVGEVSSLDRYPPDSSQRRVAILAARIVVAIVIVALLGMNVWLLMSDRAQDLRNATMQTDHAAIRGAVQMQSGDGGSGQGT